MEAAYITAAIRYYMIAGSHYCCETENKKILFFQGPYSPAIVVAAFLAKLLKPSFPTNCQQLVSPYNFDIMLKKQGRIVEKIIK